MRKSNVVLALLCAMTFILYVDRVNLSTAAGLIQGDLGLTNTQLGVAFSAFGYSYAAFQIIGGQISDRFGPRITLTLCALIWTVTTIATGFVGGLASLFLVRLLLGIGEGATLPAAAGALTAWFPQVRRGWVQGLTHSFARLGNALTPPLVAGIVAYSSWRASFVIVGFASAIWMVAWLILFRDDPRREKLDAEELRHLPPPVPPVSRPVPWGRLLTRLAPTTLTYFCYGWTGWLYFTWLPTFFLHGYHLNLKNSALFSSGVFLGGVVGDTLGGVISDQVLKRTGNPTIGRSRVIMVCMLLSFASLAPVLLVQNLVVMALFLSAAFMFLEMTVAPLWAVSGEIAPDYAATAGGYMNMGAAVAGIISPMLFGVIIDWTGNWTAPFYGSLVLLLAGALLTFWIRPEQKLVPLAYLPSETGRSAPVT